MDDQVRARILVVDDDPAQRELLFRRLEREGYDVSVAEDGWAGLAAIAARIPDLLIVDMMMPRLDGIGVITRLRESPATATLPILMLTARDRAVDKSFGLESGADDYLGKPFEFPELLARIKALLRRSFGELETHAAAAAKGRVIVFVGAKGGVGATTIATNVAVSLTRAGTLTVLADLRPMQGTTASLLGLQPRRRVDRLPLTRSEIMTTTMVADTLIDHESGVRVLLGPSGEQDLPPVAGVTAAIEGLRQTAPIVIADIAGPFDPYGRAALSSADQVWIVTEPELASVDRAAAIVALLEQLGIRPAAIHLIANQTAPEMSVPIAVISSRVGRPVIVALPASGAACTEAVRRGAPLIDLVPDLPMSRRLRSLAEVIASGRSPSTTLAEPAAPSLLQPPAAEPVESDSTARAALRAAAARQQSSVADRSRLLL